MTVPMPQPKHLNYSLREQNVFEPLATRTQGYYDSYYPHCLREWNKLDPSLRSIDSLSKFKAELIKSLRPSKRSVFKISDIVGVRPLTRLRLGCSHLREHKFRHNFWNSSRCLCGDGDEMTEHFLLRCHHFANTRSALLEQVSDILKTEIKILPDHRSAEILLYGDNNCNEIANKLIIEATIAFIKLWAFWYLRLLPVILNNWSSFSSDTRRQSNNCLSFMLQLWLSYLQGHSCQKTHVYRCDLWLDS